MELSTARQIVETLATGVHPVTGEVMPHDSPYNAPPVIRALFLVIKALNQASAKRTGELNRRSFSIVLNLEAVDDSHARSMIEELANRGQAAAGEGEFSYCGVDGTFAFDTHSLKEHAP